MSDASSGAGSEAAMAARVTARTRGTTATTVRPGAEVPVDVEFTLTCVGLGHADLGQSHQHRRMTIKMRGREVDARVVGDECELDALVGHPQPHPGADGQAVGTIVPSVGAGQSVEIGIIVKRSRG